jgi:hypothetical protein
LIQAEKMASLGQLTAGIAHEIKNRLNFVNNFAALSVDLLAELKEAAAPGFAALTEDQRVDIDEVSAMLTSNPRKITEHGKRADGIVKAMTVDSELNQFTEFVVTLPRGMFVNEAAPRRRLPLRRRFRIWGSARRFHLDPLRPDGRLRLPVRRRRKWRVRGPEAGHLIAMRVHALPVKHVVALLQTHLRHLSGSEPGDGAQSRAFGGANRGTSSATDCRAEPGSEHGARDAGQHLAVIRRLRAAGDLLAGEIHANGLILPEHLERLVRGRHHRDGRTHGRSDTAANQQQRRERGFQ